MRSTALVMCNDKGDEETVTDVITLNKNNQHLSRHVRGLPRLWDASAPESSLSALVSHLVWHVSVRQSEAGAL